METSCFTQDTCLKILGRSLTVCGRSSVVERQLPKLNVAGSNPVARSIFYKNQSVAIVFLYF